MGSLKILAVAVPGRRPGWADLVSEEFAIPHLWLPDLANSEVAKDSLLGRTLRDHLLDRDFLSEPLVERLIFRTLRDRGREGCILSGVPLSAELLTRVARRFSFSHALLALGGLPARAGKSLDLLRRALPSLDLPDRGSDESAARAAGRFLRRCK